MQKSESPSTSSSRRVYTTRIEEQNSEPVRTERSYERKADRFDRDRDDDFIKGFEDMRVGRREDRDRGGTRTETVSRLIHHSLKVNPSIVIITAL